MKFRVPYSRPYIGDADVAAVSAVLLSGSIAAGEYVEQFESEVAKFVNSSDAVAFSSATAALHSVFAYYAGKAIGDDTPVVLVPDITFTATANAAIAAGLEVELVDVDAETGFVDGETVKQACARIREKNPSKEILLVLVFIAGHVYDLTDISELVKDYGVHVIEDASHAFGSRYRSGEPVGSCKYAECSIFSSHAVKCFTTGEGGTVVANDTSLIEFVRLFRSHGIVRPSESKTPWNYDQPSFGLNYRMTDFAAALGLSQLSAYTDFRKRRLDVVENFYIPLFESAEIRMIGMSVIQESSNHLCIGRLKNLTREDRDEYICSARAKGIELNFHYPPLHQLTFHSERVFHRHPGAECSNSLSFSSQIVSFPLFVGMSSDHLRGISDFIINSRGSRL